MKIQTLQEDKTDVIKMDVPLFIRMLEYAREDAKTDRDLHDLAARVIKMKNKVLTMLDYDAVFKGKSETD